MRSLSYYRSRWITTTWLQSRMLQPLLDSRFKSPISDFDAFWPQRFVENRVFVLEVDCDSKCRNIISWHFSVHFSGSHELAFIPASIRRSSTSFNVVAGSRQSAKMTHDIGFATAALTLDVDRFAAPVIFLITFGLPLVSITGILNNSPFLSCENRSAKRWWLYHCWIWGAGRLELWVSVGGWWLLGDCNCAHRR